MKKLLSFIILYSFLWILWTFLILCPGTQAQWEDAQVQRLTYNDIAEGVVGLYIDDNDKLYLFYRGDTNKVLLMSKEKGGGWSQPEEICTPAAKGWYDMELGYDTRSGIIHIVSSTHPGDIYDDTLYYTNSTIPDWEVVKIDSLPGAQNHAGYYHLNMNFDSLGNVHLVWNLEFDSASHDWYRVMYTNNSTGEWVKQQVSPPIFLGYMGSGVTYLAVRKNGTVHILYYGDVSYPDILTYYVRNDSLNSRNWHTDTIPRPSRLLYHYFGGPLKVDANDRVHLFTWGCVEEDCVWPGLKRWFYYYKEDEDSIWVGPELILDSLFYFTTIFIDTESVPYVVEWDKSTYCWFFTDRKQGFWQEPYQIFDTTSMCNGLSSIYPRGPCFVLDSEGQGHAVFEGSLFEFMGVDDSLEIFYFGAPSTSVEDTLEEESKFRFQLFQNYPNPFNAVTNIQYTVGSGQSRLIHTTLKIYNILGKEVRELVNTRQSPGSYTIIWDGKDNEGKEVASGIYFYQLTVRQAHRPEQSRGKAGNYKENRKLVLIK